LAAGLFCLVLLVKVGMLPSCAVAGLVVAATHLALAAPLAKAGWLMISAYLFIWAASVAAALATHHWLRAHKITKPAARAVQARKPKMKTP
jgi:hypothetical protein